jgi:L-ascorbate metabolism protein UlaG (beta-lactamase superfamily)
MTRPRRPGRLPIVGQAGALFGLALLGATLLAPGPDARAQAGTVKLEWLSWSFFRFTSPTGKVVLTNPFIAGNPDAAVTLADIPRADLILVPNGHRDEIGQAVDIAKKTGARTVSPFELGTWFMSKGVPEAQVMRRNPGSRLAWEGITVRVVGSVHGSGSGQGTDSDLAPIYGGVAAGFMITFENNWTVYFPGSSMATRDMADWGAMYKPDAMIFLMHPNQEPRDVALAVKLVMTENPNLKTLIPHHHRVTPPPGATTLAEVRAALDALGISIPITNPARGQVYEFSK